MLLFIAHNENSQDYGKMDKIYVSAHYSMLYLTTTAEFIFRVFL